VRLSKWLAAGGFALLAGALAGPVTARQQEPPPDPKLVADGKKVFTGKGMCISCHGADGKGTPLAPNLTDAEWLNVDGTMASIIGLVKTGVTKPKKHPAPMPAMGGASLKDDEVRAVAAYVWTLSHPPAK